MRTETTSAASAIFAANRAQGSVTFDVHQVEGVTRRRRCMNRARCASAFLPRGAKACRPCWSTPPAASPAATGSISIIAVGEGSSPRDNGGCGESLSLAGPAAAVDISLRLQAGAHLAWLPQETILFDRARVTRRIDIDLHEEASLLLARSWCSAAPRWTSE